MDEFERETGATIAEAEAIREREKRMAVKAVKPIEQYQRGLLTIAELRAALFDIEVEEMSV